MTGVEVPDVNLYIRKNEFVTCLALRLRQNHHPAHHRRLLENSSSGRVLFDGEDITNHPPYKRR